MFEGYVEKHGFQVNFHLNDMNLEYIGFIGLLIRISEPYSSVGENNTEFSKEIKTQLRTQLNFPEDHIQDLYVSEDTKNTSPSK